MTQQNPFTNLKDGSRVMLSVYIETPKETESYPFTEEGLKQASKLYWEYVKEIKSDDYDYRVRLFSDDGISDIEFVSDNQLTKGQKLLYKLFLSGFYAWG